MTWVLCDLGKCVHFVKIHPAIHSGSVYCPAGWTSVKSPDKLNVMQMLSLLFLSDSLATKQTGYMEQATEVLALTGLKS